MDTEGKQSMKLWLQLTAGISVLMGGYVWNSVQIAKEQNAENNKQIAVARAETKEQISILKIQMENAQQQLTQHSQLFTELRGMILRNEDTLRKTTEDLSKQMSGNAITLDKVNNQQNQILDDLHWVKAGMLTDKKYEDFKSEQASTAKQTNSNSPTKATTQ